MKPDINDVIRELEFQLRDAKNERAKARRKAAWADPEVRARMSAAKKAAWNAKDERDGAPKQIRKRGAPNELPRLASLGAALALCGSADDKEAA